MFVHNPKEPEKKSFNPLIGMIVFAVIGGIVGFLWGYQKATKEAEVNNKDIVSICRSRLFKCFINDGDIIVKDQSAKKVICPKLIRKYNECKDKNHVDEMDIFPKKSSQD